MGIGSAIGGIAGAAGSVFGGMQSASAQKQAAHEQAVMQMLGLQMQMQQWWQTQQNIGPFLNAGKSALNALQTMTGTNEGGNPLTAPLTAKFDPTMEQLAATPGYKFALNQGLLAAQNNAAAKGYGMSGPAVQGAIDYAEGLASTTYQQAFNNYWSQNKDIFSMLQQPAAMGLNAAVGQGSLGQQFANNAGNLLTGIGNTFAAGTIGSTNAMIGGINNAIAFGNANMGNGSLFQGAGKYFGSLWDQNPNGTVLG